MLTVISPPLKEVRELAQRSMCIGGDVFIIRELGVQPLTLIENILTIKNFS